MGVRSPSVVGLVLRHPLDDADDGDHGGEHDDAGELDDDGDGEHGGAGGAGRGDHLADLVDAGARPGAELQVGEPERALEQGQQHQRDGPEEGDHGDRDGDVLLVGSGGVFHAGDGRGPADGGAGADEQAPGRG